MGVSWYLEFGFKISRGVSTWLNFGCSPFVFLCFEIDGVSLFILPFCNSDLLSDKIFLNHCFVAMSLLENNFKTRKFSISGIKTFFAIRKKKFLHLFFYVVTNDERNSTKIPHFIRSCFNVIYSLLNKIISRQCFDFYFYYTWLV